MSYPTDLTLAWARTILEEAIVPQQRQFNVYIERKGMTKAQIELAPSTLAMIAGGLFIAAVIGTVTGTYSETRDIVASFYMAINFYVCAHIIAGKV